MTLATTQDAIRVSERILAHMDKFALISSRLREDPSLLKHVNAMDLHTTGMAIRTTRLWRKEGRQVLAVHPGIVDATRMATSDKVPPEVFRAIPYLNPFVVYPDPPVIASHTPGETLRVLGFLTYAHGTYFDAKDLVKADIAQIKRTGTAVMTTADDALTSTHDPNATMLGMYAHVEATDEAGRFISMEENMISTPLVGKARTIRELGDEVAERYHWQDADTGETFRRGDERREFLKDLQGVMLGSLLYLCSTTLEAEQVPKKFVAKMRPGVARKPISLFKVGWQTGAAVSRFRHSPVTGETPTLNRAGREQEPQHRRAHFKVVWTGKGKTVPKTVFISPYWTHREKLGDFGINTARRVM